MWLFPSLSPVAALSHLFPRFLHKSVDDVYSHCTDCQKHVMKPSEGSLNFSISDFIECNLKNAFAGIGTRCVLQDDTVAVRTATVLNRDVI